MGYICYYNINIRLIKLPSHSGIFGNSVADNLAKQAAAISYNCKYKFDRFKYSTYWNPIGVDMLKDLIMYRKYVKYNTKIIAWMKIINGWKVIGMIAIWYFINI